MDSKGIKKLHKQVEELHTESQVASGSERRETKCAIPPRVCVIFLFLSNPCCSYIIFFVWFFQNFVHQLFYINIHISAEIMQCWKRILAKHNFLKSCSLFKASHDLCLKKIRYIYTILSTMILAIFIKPA